MKLNLNQSGMSMTETVMAVGLVGMGALAAASLSGNLSNATKRSEGIVARSQFAASFGSYLYTSLGCEDLKAARSNYSETAQPITISKWNYMGMNQFMGGYDAKGDKLTKTKYFDIEALEAYYEPIAGAPLVEAKLAGGVSTELAKSILKIRAVLKVGEKSQEFFYNIPVLVAGDGRLGYCSEEKTVAETCASIQGAYNSDTAKCDLAEGCVVRGSYATFSCSSSDITACDQTKFGDLSTQVNSYTGAKSCPPESAPTLTHSTVWTSQAKTGKKSTSIVTNTMAWYSCMACPKP